MARRTDAIVAVSCRDCSLAIAEKSFTSLLVEAIVLCRSRMPPVATSSCCSASVIELTDCITESALLVSSAMPGEDGPTGTVSPGL